MRRLILMLSFALLAGTAPAQAQEPSVQRITQLVASDTVFEVHLTGGESYIGQVAAVDGDRITLQTATGVQVQFGRAQIQSIRPARGRIVNGQFWRDDSNRTRLFFAPTGRTLEAGDGYAGLFFILPFVSYGATDWMTLSGGIPLIGGSDGGVPFFYLAPKVRVISKPSVQVSTGVLAVFGLDDEVGGIAYGVGSWGSSDHALTAGAGIPFASGDGFADEFLMMVGGETRVTRRLKLLSENWFVPGESGALLSGGIRLLGERWTTDLGLAAAVESGSFFYFPLVSFAYAFGGGR